MSYPTRRWYFSLIFLLSASVVHADGEAINRVLQQQPALAGFDICHSGGCADISRVSLSAEEWQQVIHAFDPKPQTADAERNCIANAIGVMEQLVGAKTATDADRGGTFRNFASPGQLDCNDEATNSTTYMKLMMQAGLIRFHEILDTKTRGYFYNGWPHTTAVIREKKSEQQSDQDYAVDSWFYYNGVPAVVVPLNVWKSGWRPGDSQAY